MRSRSIASSRAAFTVALSIALGGSLVPALFCQTVFAEPASEEIAIDDLATDAAVPADKDVASHGAHEHGVGRLDLAVDGAHVALELTLAAQDVVGFEHEAKSSDEKAKAAQAKSLLEDPAKLFGYPAAAGCTASVDDVSNSIEESEDEEAGERESGEHAEYLASYVLRCKDISKLSSVTVKLFTAFPSLTAVKVQSATDKGQSSSVLTKERAVIEGL